ncbi:type II secretory pathway component PulF [Clostridium tetanomorphum]|uniref:Uncharacterized protein n=1 Tax=Clostridium tetanomorphum TaxID=1553 RepID=A0A923EBA9_CLOTT|nr:hypothetical protein [Clostridium tetanomorphum]KAJ52889.1 hypothetical protein CTM_05322 [Clostridium tetanomorphum DSM 665]MBC2399900.1 hypothetical protein [Clostridium tetanomorphum]MBP1865973.1 type II secretory pathway component PulF [Clostridium tetanomorphum]NRS85973.1 type II secretory pathway component PulF [Clostridium tetanomorphum]NRZ96017.1 type II secretory pathway component PulF [Clostridium tetanomorphum]
MRKAIGVLGWCTVFFTTISLILTILTTCQFIYVKYFNSYFTLQWCIFFTMVVWSIKLIDLKGNIKGKILYPALCLIFAVGTMFFIFMKVY